MSNFSNRWSKDDTSMLLANLNKYGLKDLPLAALETRLNRSQPAILKKAERLLEQQSSKYPWVEEESEEAFNYYLEGLSTSTILEKLHEDGSHASLEDIELELKRLRALAVAELKSYAEERGLKPTKNITLTQLQFFFKNRETTSKLLQTALNSRIQNG